MQRYTIKAIETGVYQGWVFTLIAAFIMQYYGSWILMIPAGAIGGLFTKRHRHAFIAGFLGVACAWSAWFGFLVANAQAYIVGEFLAALIGLPGFGRFIVSFSILFGGLLGASGALVGRSVIELAEEFIMKEPPMESRED